MTTHKDGKRTPAVAITAGLLATALAVGGTIAWLTASNTVTNTFTVGQITNPVDPDKPNPGLPDPGDEDTDGTDATLTGNIYELFEPDSKLASGISVTKTPYIGIGENSEDSYVFAYVDNKTLAAKDTAKSPYFTLNDGWAPVDGQADAYTGADKVDGKTFVGGLFKWVGTGNDSATDAKVLEGSDANAVWTGAVFDDITVPNATAYEDFTTDGQPTIDVSCFLYAKTGDDVTASTAQGEAVTWATTGNRAPSAGGATA